MIRETPGIAGMHPSVLRRANSIEIFHAIRLKPGISQREISARTGVDKSTVSTVVSYFDGLGLLSRSPDDTPGRRGRPSEGLSLRGDVGLLVGIDIVPDSIVVISSGLDGKPAATGAYPAIDANADVARAVEAALRSHLAASGQQMHDVRSIGICVPGLINRSGAVVESPNLRWRDVVIQEALSSRLGRPVLVGNDARAAGLAEKLFGCCIDVNDYIFIDSHSGVGGALFLDGMVYTGPGGFAGEVGHVKVVPFGRICDCGASGCLSAYISQPALRRRFAALGLGASDFRAMRSLAEDGNPDAAAILDEAGEMLGVALSDFINLFNPPNIVLGGGLAVLSPQLLPAVTRVLRRQALAAPFAQSRLLVSELALEDVPRGPLALALDGLSHLAAEGPFPW